MIYFPNRNKPQSLSAQIRAAERRVLNRQRQIGIHAATITQKIGQQMTTPPNLLLAGGIGFIIGEFTKATTTAGGNCNNRPATQTTPLKIALNLVSSIQTLYTALPLVWIMKSAYQPKMSKPAPEQGLQSVPAPPTTASGQSS